MACNLFLSQNNPASCANNSLQVENTCQFVKQLPEAVFLILENNFACQATAKSQAYHYGGRVLIDEDDDLL